MGLIVTPTQLKQKGEFYHQLASMTSAGVTIIQAVDMLRRQAPNAALRTTCNRVMDGLNRGQNFNEALHSTGQEVPDFDVSLIEAGEASGRLDHCFRLLGDFYRERGQLASQVLTQLLYPIFLVHFAVLIFPTTLLADLVWKGATGPYLINKISILLPLYASVAAVLWLASSNRGVFLRALLEQISLMIPLLGSLRRDLALVRLCAALEALINAGVTIIEAWDLAGRASGSPRIIRSVAAVKPRLQSGELPSEAIATQGIYPELFLSSYRTGEMSGQLDDALRRLYRHYQEKATESFKRLAEWFPKLIYIGVMLGIAYFIVSFYAGLFSQQNQILKDLQQ